jgi:hypothetical protein
MSSNRPRSREAPRIIDADFKREGSNWTDARRRHQATADCIMLAHLQEHSVQSLQAFEDRPPHIEHGLDGRHEDRIAPLEQLANASFVTTPADRSD